MKTFSIKFISAERANEIINNMTRRRNYGLFVVRGVRWISGSGESQVPIPTYTAIDNSTGDAFIEEFNTCEGAIAWLQRAIV